MYFLYSLSASIAAAWLAIIAPCLAPMVGLMLPSGGAFKLAAFQEPASNLSLPAPSSIALLQSPTSKRARGDANPGAARSPIGSHRMAQQGQRFPPGASQAPQRSSGRLCLHQAVWGPMAPRCSRHPGRPSGAGLGQANAERVLPCVRCYETPTRIVGTASPFGAGTPANCDRLLGRDFRHRL